MVKSGYRSYRRCEFDSQHPVQAAVAPGDSVLSFGLCGHLHSQVHTQIHTDTQTQIQTQTHTHSYVSVTLIGLASTLWGYLRQFLLRKKAFIFEDHS